MGAAAGPARALHAGEAGAAGSRTERPAARAAAGIEEVQGGLAGVGDHAAILRPEGALRPSRAPAYNGGMQVTVLLFASIAEKAGLRRLELPLEPGDTVAAVRDRLLARFPHLAGFVPTLMYALDEEYVRDSASVPPGATLALIPPVSGG